MLNSMCNFRTQARGTRMVISYKKLWKLLIDKDMKKRDLQEAADLSSSTVAKLTHGENVSTAILLRICTALKCDVADIMEVIPEAGESVGGTDKWEG